MTKPQRGNALFLILIAVALFAALSYAITQSSRGGGAGTKKETDAILAAQIVQSGAVLKAAAMRMVFSGTPAADIKLHLPASSTDPCTVTDGTCLFTDGGATWPSFPDNAYNQALITMLNMPSLGLGKPHASEAGDNCSGASGECGAAMAGLGTDLPEVGIGLSAVAENICLAIDKGLGLSSIPVENAASFMSHIGDGYVYFSAVPGSESICVDISEAAGMDPSAGMFVYNQVLVPR